MKTKPAKPTLHNWMQAFYPFDRAECGDCLTFHLVYGCKTAMHAPLVKEIKEAIPIQEINGILIRKHYAALLALREKYDRFWPARGR